MRTSTVLILTFTIISSLKAGTTTITDANKNNCPHLIQAAWSGPCISDWAIAVAGAVSSQLCLKKSAFKTLRVSYQDLICNCDACHIVKGNGCMGGKVEEALNFIRNKGAVGGGAHGMNDNQPTFTAEQKGPKIFKYCTNYYGEECYMINLTGKKQCAAGSNKYDQSTQCFDVCKYNSDVAGKKVDEVREKEMITSSAKITGKSSMVTALEGGANILVGFMEIYEDFFFADQNAVYIHTTGQSLGIHAVQILGYVTEGGMSYWQVLPPFGAEVAGGGVVKVLANANHCNIEDIAYKFEVKVDY